MKIKLFTIPIDDIGEMQEQMNGFLASHKVLDIKKELIQSHSTSYWAFCITYLDGAGEQLSQKKGKIDYREVLSPEDFSIFSKMRAIRKEMAQKEAVQAYNIFLDADLAEMVKLMPLDIKKMQSISGIGEKKVEKYGEEFISRLSDLMQNETSGQVDGKSDIAREPSDSLF